MSWISLDAYGFKKPYNAPVALLVLIGISLFFLALIASVSTYFFVGPYSLSFENAMFSYFFYVGSLGLLTALLAPYKRLALIIFIVGIFELCLGFGLATVNKLCFRINHLLPEQHGSVRKDLFTYHPLLVGIPKHNSSQEGTAGRIRITHNKYGQRAVETSSDTGVNYVAVFGGSSTYDIGISNPNTWPEALASDLGVAFQVRNNGVIGYGTVEHLIQTAFYVDRGFADIPNCALYYVGWNDIRNIGLGAVDTGFADYHLLQQYDTLGITTGDVLFSPLAILSIRILSSQFIPRVERYDPSDVKMFTDEDILNSKAFKVSFNNLYSIIALNERRGISTLLVPQIMNPSLLVGDTSDGWLLWLAKKDVMRVLDHFNKKLEMLASGTSAIFIPVAQSKFVKSDFVDIGHFSESGAKKFASFLLEDVRTACGFQK